MAVNNHPAFTFYHLLAFIFNIYISIDKYYDKIAVIFQEGLTDSFHPGPCRQKIKALRGLPLPSMISP